MHGRDPRPARPQRSDAPSRSRAHDFTFTLLCMSEGFCPNGACILIFPRTTLESKTKKTSHASELSPTGAASPVLPSSIARPNALIAGNWSRPCIWPTTVRHTCGHRPHHSMLILRQTRSKVYRRLVERTQNGRGGRYRGALSNNC